MSKRKVWFGSLLILSLLSLPASAARLDGQAGPPAAERRAPWNPKVLGGSEFSVVKPGNIVPPRVAPPCPPGRCPFAGQSVTVLVSRSLIAGVLPELKDEFEAATGARLEVVEAPYNEHFENFLSEAINHRSTYDTATEYYSLRQHRWITGARPNQVGNTTGGNWAGVISTCSKAPAATYYLLALMATREKSQVYAARGRDAIDPGRRYHFLPHDGSARLATYLKAGWDEGDVREYLHAYYANFSNPLQLPCLRIPGTFAYWQALGLHLAQAAAGQLRPEAALKAAAVDSRKSPSASDASGKGVLTGPRSDYELFAVTRRPGQ